MADVNAAKPPRLTEKPDEDFYIIQGWMQDVFDALVDINNDVIALTARVTALEP